MDRYEDNASVDYRAYLGRVQGFVPSDARRCVGEVRQAVDKYEKVGVNKIGVMEVSDSVYKMLAKLLLDTYKEYKEPYFKGYVMAEGFSLTISCIFYDDNIVPVWYECEDKYDFEFGKLRTKYKELWKNENK